MNSSGRYALSICSLSKATGSNLLHPATPTMKRFVLILGVIVLSGCFMPKGDDSASQGTNDSGSKKDVSPALSSFFEPSAEEKAQADKIKSRQSLLQRQNQQMQKERLQSY
jgi:hypothetical protein